MESAHTSKDVTVVSKAAANQSSGPNGAVLPAVPVLQQIEEDSLSQPIKASPTPGFTTENPQPPVQTKFNPQRHPAQLQSVAKTTPARFIAQQHEPESSGEAVQLQRYDPGSIPVQKKANNTGLPNNLKSGIENLSGFSMDDVRVHYNSSQPAQLNAHAYAQGADIHIAQGQEKHLPHEAWHVVQQKQGRVQATMQMKNNVPVNDDAGLEKEADVMGAKALSTSEPSSTKNDNKAIGTTLPQNTVQLVKWRMVKGVWVETDTGKPGEPLELPAQNGKNAWKNGDVFDEEMPAWVSAESGTAEGRYLTSGGWSKAAYDQKNKKAEPVVKPTGGKAKAGGKKPGGYKPPGADGEAEAEEPKNVGKVKFYRTMTSADYEKVMARDFTGLRNKLGDRNQALRYLLGTSEDVRKMMVEFEIETKKVPRFFSAETLALPPQPKPKGGKAKVDHKATDHMRAIFGQGGSQIDEATAAEGYSANKIGVKQESAGEAGYSIMLGTAAQHAVKFMDFVSKMTLVATSIKIEKSADRRIEWSNGTVSSTKGEKGWAADPVPKGGEAGPAPKGGIDPIKGGIEADKKAADGVDSRPTTAQNERLATWHLKTIWVEPDGYCMFGSMAVLLGTSVEELMQKLIVAIGKNTDGIREFIVEKGSTPKIMFPVIRNIGTKWNDPAADIIIPLLCRMENKAVTILQPDGEFVDVHGAGGDVLVHVTSPVSHYHATGPIE